MTFRRQFLTLVAAATVSFGLLPAFAGTAAEDPKGAQGFVNSLATSAFKTLNTGAGAKQKDADMRVLLREGFDLDYIGSLLLGRHRQTASKAQLDSYTRIFPDYLMTVYVSRLSDYSKDTFKVTGAAPAGKSDLFVTSQLVRKKGQVFLIDWRVRKNPAGAFKIIDVKIEGISLTVTQRDEFASRISTSGMDALLADLKSGVRFDEGKGK